MFYIKQLSNEDCGLACLKTLLANLYKEEKYLYLQQDENHGPYSYEELIEIAQEYGVTLTGIKVEAGNFEPFHPLPSLVAISGEGHTLHLVYLKKISKTRVYFFDPDKGMVSMTKKAFLSIWDRTALIVESYQEEEVKIPRYDIKPKERIITLLFNLLSLAGIITGLLFIDKNSYYFIPIICFALSIIFELVNQKYLSILMKRMDDRCLEDLKRKPSNPKTFLLALNNYKKTLFLAPIHFFTDIIVVTFIIVILAINNVYNNLIVISAILISVLRYLCIDPYLKKKEREIARIEEFKNSDNLDDFKEEFLILHQETYKYVSLASLFRALKIFALFAVVILVMMINQIVSVPFVLVYLSFGLIITIKTDKIIAFPKEIEEVKKNRARLSNQYFEDNQKD